MSRQINPPIKGDCGSWEWHEWMDEPYEPLIRCGNYLGVDR